MKAWDPVLAVFGTGQTEEVLPIPSMSRHEFEQLEEVLSGKRESAATAKKKQKQTKPTQSFRIKHRKDDRSAMIDIVACLCLRKTCSMVQQALLRLSDAVRVVCLHRLAVILCLCSFPSGWQVLLEHTMSQCITRRDLLTIRVGGRQLCKCP